jgi:acyl dehydratase
MTAAFPASRSLGPFDEGMILSYVSAAGDDNPVHQDAAVARAAGFANILVPGMLLAAHIAHALEETPTVQELRGLSTRFARPVLPGQTLRLEARPIAQHPKDRMVMILRLKVHGPDGLVVMGEAEVRLSPA